MAFRLRIPRDLYEQMIEQARSELPNECCGLLAGRIVNIAGQDVGQVSARHALRNEMASPIEYLSEGRSMFDAYRAMRERETEILAVYHSHPTSDPIPSGKDLERSYSPDVVNVIISLKTGEPEVRSWWLTSTNHQEAEWELTDEVG